MRYRLQDIPALLRTPVGRLQFLHGILLRTTRVQLFAATHYRRRIAGKPRLVAVVGSLGKTTTTRVLRAALFGRFDKRIGGNAGASLAKNILCIRPGDGLAVVEVGINGAGQMARYARLIRPDIAVVTSIASEHNRSFESLDVTRHEKAEMVRALDETGIALLNGDDPNVLWMAGQTRARVVTFGLKPANDVWAQDFVLGWPNGSRFTLHAGGRQYAMRSRLLGEKMIYPILAAVAVACAVEMPLEDVLARLERVAPTPGRLEPVTLSGGAILLRDEYKSTLETIDAALDVFAAIPAARKVLVLGEISEPPGPAGPIRRRIGGRIAEAASRAIFVCSKKAFRSYASGAIEKGFPRSELIYAGRSVCEAVRILKQDLRPGDVLLVKGRKSQCFDRISLALSGRAVRCDVDACDCVMCSCERCGMLERGWEGLRVVI